MCQCQNKEEKSLHRIYRQKLKESNIASCQCISYQYLPPQVPALQTTSGTSWLAPRVSLQHRQPCLYCLGYQAKMQGASHMDRHTTLLSGSTQREKDRWSRH